MNAPERPGFWDDADVVHAYTRAEALADGTLVDISELAAEAGFKVPVALTATVHSTLMPTEADSQIGQSFTGRLWDILMVLRANAAADGDTVLFEVLVAEAGKLSPIRLKALIGPGDDLEPVLTIMFPGED